MDILNPYSNRRKKNIHILFIRFPKLLVLVVLYLSFTGNFHLDQGKFVQKKMIATATAKLSSMFYHY